MANNSIRDTLTRLRRWCDEGNDLLEKPVETLLLLDLFRNDLAYTLTNSASQSRIGVGVSDIILKPNIGKSIRWVIVEVKRPSVELGTTAILQAARYMASTTATRGILTNGNQWCFLRIRQKKGAKYSYLVDVLLAVQLGLDHSPERKILEKICSRCGPTTIVAFFDMLTKLQELGKTGIKKEIGKHPIAGWADALMHQLALQPHGSSYRVSAHDKKVLSLLCKDSSIFHHCLIDSYQTISFRKIK